MSEIKVKRTGGRHLREPVAIVGFPSIGLVGSILASYISKEREMDMIAGITSESLPPYTLIQNGLPYPPIRIYGCTNKKHDTDLVVATSEVTPKPEDCHALSESILNLFNEIGVSRTYVLEGVAQFEGAEIVVCGTRDDTIEEAKSKGMRKLSDGLVRGLTGVMLYDGFERDMDVLAVMCPANPNMPDPRASAIALEQLSKLIPGIGLKTEPLLKEAEEMESRIRDELKTENSDEQNRLYR